VLRPVALLGALTVCGALAACGAPPGEDAVVATARQWMTAARAGDAAGMCRLLSPAAQVSVATGDDTCEQAVADLDLPGAGSVGAVEVWSDEAQVRTGDDTLFLVRLTGGWRVSGAGCTAQADRPYDCDVEG
jgi:hypothetical protein